MAVLFLNSCLYLELHSRRVSRDLFSRSIVAIGQIVGLSLSFCHVAGCVDKTRQVFLGAL